MALTGQGSFTGLMGYERNYTYLGDSVLPLILTEKYTYTVYDILLQNRSGLPQFFKSQFATQLGRFANDINITSLKYENTRDHLSSSVAFQKYSISFEVRSSGQFLNSHVGDAGYTGSRNLGLTGILSHVGLIRDFRDSFSLSLSESANKDFVHNVSFSLRTGEGHSNFQSLKSVAQEIATSVFNNEPDTLSRAAFDAYGAFNDQNSRHYYDEVFNSLTFDFSFSKRVSLEAFLSGNYTHSISHSVTFAEDGNFEVSEKLKVVGKSSYSDAIIGFGSLNSGSLSRCQNVFSTYTPLLNYSNYNSNLIEVGYSEVRNIPSITIEGTFDFSNNPARKSGLTKTEGFEINRSEEGVWTINHGLRYSLDRFLNTNTDNVSISGSNTILDMIRVDRSASPNRVNALYDSLNEITGRVTGLFRVKTSVDAPQRGKSYSASFNYTSDPTFDNSEFVNPFGNVPITGFKKLSIDSQNTLPQDSISEYKIINRPSQDSILHYGYQQTPATFSVSVNGKLPRRGNCLYSASRYIPSGEAHALLNMAKATFLNSALTNTDVYNYFVKDLSFGCDSNNTFDMSVQFGYTKKRL
jgi:hypothetical protein